MTSPHLVGAYGMFWERDQVNWYPGSGKNPWQLLGRIYLNRPRLTACDFRKAQGFYALYDDFGANYVGLARGSHGIGSRLRSHVADDTKDWSRFSWFALDDVTLPDDGGWACIDRRNSLDNMSTESVLRECEALLITVLGSRNQNSMRFQQAERWEQLREIDFRPGGVARRLPPKEFKDPWLCSLLLTDE